MPGYFCEKFRELDDIGNGKFSPEYGRGIARDYHISAIPEDQIVERLRPLARKDLNAKTYLTFATVASLASISTSLIKPEWPSAHVFVATLLLVEGLLCYRSARISAQDIISTHEPQPGLEN